MKVIKLGGSLLDDPARRAQALGAIADAWKRGDSLVLVHGGGKHIDAALAKLGIAKKTCGGLRVTDDATLPTVVSVLAGSVNKMLVAELTALGVRTAGFSGADASTLVAIKHPPIDGVDLGHVGQVVGSNRALLRMMTTYGMLPVVASIAEGPDGTLLNVNADSAAAAIAVAMDAESLRFITDVPGVMGADGSVVTSIAVDEAHALLAGDVVSGGMKPKLEAALHALRSGVRSIVIGEEGGTHLVAA